MSDETLADRVAWLIERSHAGSVNAAAKECGVPQRSLARIANGQAPHPRADVVLQLATYYDTTADWLLRGVGERPNPLRRVRASVNVTRDDLYTLAEASDALIGPNIDLAVRVSNLHARLSARLTDAEGP